jgi:hypothetical protein
MAKKQLSQVDITGFKKAVAGLAKLSGKTFEKAMESEVGMTLRGATIKTKVASIKGRKSRGKIRGGIVPQRMPKGLSHAGGDGGKLVTKKDGRFYHIGEPVKAGRAKPRWVTRNGKKVFKTGAKLYANPYPRQGGNKGQAWLRKQMFGQYVPQQIDRTMRAIENRGITAGQFYWMAHKLGITMPTNRISKDSMNAIKSTHVRKVVFRRLGGTKKMLSGSNLTIITESRGIKMSAKRGVQQKLLESLKARTTLFRTAMKKEFYKDMKKFMPSRYPLLFK